MVSVGGTANCYRLDGPEFHLHWKQGMFTSPKPVQIGSGEHEALSIGTVVHNRGKVARAWCLPHTAI
jgi:hypothetical protein